MTIAPSKFHIDAAEHGGKFLYLANFYQSGLSLREYSDAFHQREAGRICLDFPC
jgi:hypothetical protein